MPRPDTPRRNACKAPSLGRQATHPRDARGGCHEHAMWRAWPPRWMVVSRANGDGFTAASGGGGRRRAKVCPAGLRALRLGCRAGTSGGRRKEHGARKEPCSRPGGRRGAARHGRRGAPGTCAESAAEVDQGVTALPTPLECSPAVHAAVHVAPGRQRRPSACPALPGRPCPLSRPLQSGSRPLPPSLASPSLASPSLTSRPHPAMRAAFRTSRQAPVTIWTLVD